MGAGPGLALDTFTSHMVERLKQKDQDELIREVFVSVDVYQRGFVTESDCLAAFKQVVPQLKDETVKELFAEIDSNGDGRVSYGDFEMMMRSANIPPTTINDNI